MACSVQGVTSNVFRDFSSGEERGNSQTPTSQFGEVPKSMDRYNFTVQSASLLFSKISREALLNRVT